MAQEQHEKSVSQFKEKLLMPLDSLVVCLAFTLESSLDNFRGPSLDVELISSTLEIVLCYTCIFLKFYMMIANVLPALPFMPPNILIFMDTGAAVLACYVLLLDINWSFIWIITFPILGIFFICALSRLYSKHYSRGEDREEAGVNPSSQKEEAEDREEPSSEKKGGEDSHGEANQGSKGENLSTRSTGGSSNEKTTRIILLELQFIGIITFGALWAMDELLLDEHAIDRFTISQFLLFLSFMLVALTCMMKRLPVGIPPGIAPASEFLHKTLLVLLLVTVHTVAAEALAEEVILLCMPEVIPAVLIWFSIHHGSATVKLFEAYKMWEWRIVLGAVLGFLFAIIDESARPAWCTSMFVSCAVSGLLAHYVVCMLSHWPEQQHADDKQDRRYSGMVVQSQQPADDKQDPGKLDVQPADGKQDRGKLDVQPADDKQDPGKLAAELLKHWANELLIASAAWLLLTYLLVHGLGWREALDTLRQTFERLISAASGHTNTFWSIMPLLCSALFNLLCSSRNLHKDFPGITTWQKSFGICYNVFILLHMFCFTGDVSRTLYFKYSSISLLWKGMQRILVI